jgi:poly-gamma-glutamate synthesis protein (capsule biosynthesis protein)
MQAAWLLLSCTVAPLKAAAQCNATGALHIVAVGDILMHGPLQRYAWQAPDGFRTIWQDIVPMLTAADISYGNLEGPIAPGRTASGGIRPDVRAFNGVIYTGYPRFNYPELLASDLARSGFDLLSTSNNHTLNRGSAGADSTVEIVRRHGMVPFGSWNSQTKGLPYVIHEKRGLRTAWVACTFSTNGIPDRLNQTADCFRDESNLLLLIKDLLRPDQDVDAVIVTPHWGAEYQLDPTPAQRRLGHAFIRAGAIAVLGTHPHVLQPWEEVKRPDGELGLIAYSTGNFASNQLTFPRNISAAVHLLLGPKPDGSGVILSGYGYTPLTMGREAGGHYRVRKWDRGSATGPAAAERIWLRQFGPGRRVPGDQDPRRFLCQK